MTGKSDDDEEATTEDSSAGGISTAMESCVGRAYWVEAEGAKAVTSLILLHRDATTANVANFILTLFVFCVNECENCCVYPNGKLNAVWELLDMRYRSQKVKSS